MENIKIPSNPKKATAKPDLTPREAKAGDNQPDDSTILFFVGQLRKAQAVKDVASKALSRVWKQALNAGIVRKDLAAIMEEATEDPEAVLERYIRRKAYAQSLRVPIGGQMVLTLAPAPNATILSHKEMIEQAYKSGFARGIMGENFDEQAYGAGNELTPHAMEGWRAGQDILLMRIKQLDAADPPPAADGQDTVNGGE